MPRLTEIDPIAAVLDALRLGHRRSQGPLTVVPLLGSELRDPGWLTLPEAGDGVQVGEVSDAGAVPELRVINQRREAVLLLDGEELVGARQNRVLNTTVLVPAGASVIIPVSCVEQGRWGYRARHFRSGQRENGRTRMPRGNQLARQWRLLKLLGRPAGVEVGAAAEVLGCAVRTVWRDLRVLQDADFPIYDDRSPDGRRSVWRTTDRVRLPLRLSLEELAALVMVRDLLAPTGTAVLGSAVQSAFEKIAGLLGRDALDLLNGGSPRSRSRARPVRRRTRSPGRSWCSRTGWATSATTGGPWRPRRSSCARRWATGTAYAASIRTPGTTHSARQRGRRLWPSTLWRR